MQADALILADHLYTAHTNDESAPEFISPGAIAIKDGKIIALGSAETVKSQVNCPQSQISHLSGHLLMPGLINSHAHSAMTLFRGMADDLPLMTWLQDHIWPAEGQWVSEAFVRAGTRLAMAEMLLSGTTSFTDMYFFPETVAAEAQKAGMRTFLACPIMDFPTNWGSGPQEYLEKTLALIKRYHCIQANTEQPVAPENNTFGGDTNLITVGFGPHAPYSVSDEPLEEIASLAKDHATFIHMHVHETQQEVTDALTNSGQRPLSRLNQLGLLGANFQAVHFTASTPEDIALAAEKGITVVHCPASNLKLASGFAPVAQLLKANVNVTLGTDGAASNNALDMFSELRLASLLAKANAKDASACPARTSLRLATANAGKALAAGSQLGQLRIGAPADCIAIKLEGQLNVQPLYHPLSQLVYALNSAQVNHAWINGQRVMAERKLLTLNLEDILAQTVEWQTKLSQPAR